MRAAIYVRISQDRAGEQLGVERQEQDCRTLATQQGWEVVNVYTDNDVSAYSRRPRPAYREMLRGLERGEFNAIVAYRSDRLYRRMVDLSELIGIVERLGTEIATVTTGRIDLGTVDGRMIANIVGSVAEAESGRIGERVARQRLTQVSEGRRQGAAFVRSAGRTPVCASRTGARFA